MPVSLWDFFSFLYDQQLEAQACHTLMQIFLLRKIQPESTSNTKHCLMLTKVYRYLGRP